VPFGRSSAEPVVRAFRPTLSGVGRAEPGPAGGQRPQRHSVAPLPHCQEGSVKTTAGAIYPAAPIGKMIGGLPDDVKDAWREARVAHNVAAYTASEMMCRKILMHLAVDKAGSDPGKHFVES